MWSREILDMNVSRIDSNFRRAPIAAMPLMRNSLALRLRVTDWVESTDS